MAYQTFPPSTIPGGPKPSSATLLDAPQTITPGTSKLGIYRVPQGTLTANRILTLAVADCLQTQLVRIVVQDTSAFTYTIINGNGGATIYVHGPSAGTACTYECYFTGGNWTASVLYWAS